MKILKIVLEPSATYPAKYDLAIAIESRPGHWKAYKKTVARFPVLEDVNHVANTGTKFYERTKAESTFGTIPNLEYEY